MNGKKLSAALTALPEDLVEEAMEPGHRGRSFSWLRLAACVAIIIGLFFGFWPTEPEIVTAPGLLTVTVYAMDENSETGYTSEVLETGVEISNNRWSIAQNFYPGIPVNMVVSSEEFPAGKISFLVTVDAGVYIDWIKGEEQELPDQFERTNDTWIYWRAAYVEEFLTEAFDHVYSDIIIYCEDNIVGYAVLRFDRVEGKGLTYTATLVSSVYFPKQNGEYQEVTYEYVCECIAECRG